ncbi:hypothetical protein M0P65_05170 [Candidatus Gracilibacteria bacterium]|nr:hypothetical protein [Candidatus Gracilibacteria bacterium]
MKKNILDIEEYVRDYKDQLISENLWNYFLRETKRGCEVSFKMLKYNEDETVYGGSWPGNYGLLYIFDYSKYKVLNVEKVGTEKEYVYFVSKLNEYVNYTLRTTLEEIEVEKNRLKYSIYSLPSRFYDEFKDSMLVKVDGNVCFESKMNADLLEKALSSMTPVEKAVYYKKINKINIDLHPTIEFPIKIRIIGIDDGAEECFFSSKEDVDKCLRDLNSMCDKMFRKGLGFIKTD